MKNSIERLKQFYEKRDFAGLAKWLKDEDVCKLTGDQKKAAQYLFDQKNFNLPAEQFIKIITTATGDDAYFLFTAINKLPGDNLLSLQEIEQIDFINAYMEGSSLSSNSLNMIALIKALDSPLTEKELAVIQPFLDNIHDRAQKRKTYLIFYNLLKNNVVDITFFHSDSPFFPLLQPKKIKALTNLLPFIIQLLDLNALNKENWGTILLLLETDSSYFLDTLKSLDYQNPQCPRRDFASALIKLAFRISKVEDKKIANGIFNFFNDRIIKELGEKKLITVDVMNAIAENYDTDAVGFFKYLIENDILTQPNIQKGIPFRSVFTSIEITEELVPLLRDVKSNQVAFEFILSEIQAITQNTKIIPSTENLISILSKTLRKEVPKWLKNVAAYNYEQSTHTKSVELSASHSATELKTLYAAHASTNIKEDLNHYLSKQKGLSSYKHDAIKKAIELIEKSYERGHGWLDKLTGIKLKELLSYLWAASEDKNKLLISPKEAKERILEALFEIQRGNSIDDTGKDTDKPDDPLCLPGIFNKLLESLWGIHPSVKLEYVTMQTASLKLKQIVIKEAGDYYINQLLSEDEKIPSEVTLESIWPTIKPLVLDKMNHAFPNLYTDKKDPRWLEMIDHGQYIEDEAIQAYINQTLFHNLSPSLKKTSPQISNPKIVHDPEDSLSSPIHKKPSIDIDLLAAKVLAKSKINAFFENKNYLNISDSLFSSRAKKEVKKFKHKMTQEKEEFLNQILESASAEQIKPAYDKFKFNVEKALQELKPYLENDLPTLTRLSNALLKLFNVIRKLFSLNTYKLSISPSVLFVDKIGKTICNVVKAEVNPLNDEESNTRNKP